MAVKFTNNAATTLAAGINSSVTSIAVTDGSVFPTITGSDHFYVTFDDTTNKEIVKVTARSGNTLTVVRGHDNTTARAFNSGDKAELRVVAALLEDVKTDVTSTLTVDTFTGNGSATAFTLSVAPASEDNLIVFIEGVYQNPGDFTLSGTTLTFDVAPANSRNIIVYHVAALVSGNNLTHNQFTCNGSTTAFTLGLSPIHENNTQVFLDGVYQQKTDYAVSGTTLTMDTAPANGAILEVMTFTQTDVNTLPASFVSGLTQVTAVGADHFMIFDATDSALKKSLVSDVLESATSISTSADATAITIDSNERVTFTSDVTTGGHLSVGGNNNELRFYEGSNYVGFEAPALSADKIWVLPAADGSNGQVISTDGSGNLSFSTVSGTTINNNADNRIITGSGTANTLEGEANLRFDGTNLVLDAAGASVSADDVFGAINFFDQDGGSSAAGVTSSIKSIAVGAVGASKLTFSTSTSGGGARSSLTEKVVIDESGYIGVGNLSPQVNFVVGDGTNGTSLEVTPNESSGFVNMNSYDRGSSAWRTMNIGGDVVTLNTGGSERMRIDSSGNVGINESSPDFSGFGSNGGGLELDDVGANFTAIRVSHGATGDFYMAANTGAAYLWGKANSPIVIGTNNTEKMRILEDGDLRLGTSSIVFSSGEKMSILHNGGHGLGIKTSGDVSYQPLALFNNTTGTAVIARFEVGYGPAGAISSNATTTTYGQPSDYRLKENIVPLPSATAKVNALNPVRFNMIANPENTTVDGFIAHEVQEIVPEAVVHQKDAIDEDGNPEYQQMDASKLIPIMVKTIQELEARITTLESS